MDIFASQDKLEVGKVYTYDDLRRPLSYAGQESSRDYRFLVVREATQNDYIKECLSLGFTDAEINDYMRIRRNFYFVSMD